MKNSFIPAKIQYLFCNRNYGENLESDLLLTLAKNLGLKTITFSSKNFEPALRKKDMEEWRSRYHWKVIELISPFQNDLIILAGYMLIVSPEMCNKFTIINLHPAAPNGPAGTWQEVIWKLIEQKADETGVMMHLVTEVLDEGPPITYCTFPIRGEKFDHLWEKGESDRLFDLIRKEGVTRELPLIVLTLKTLAEGRVIIKDKKVLNPDGKEIGPYCLNKEVEEYLTPP